MDNKILIHTEIDLQAITDAIARAGDLNQNNEVFGHLAQLKRLKDQFDEAKQQLDDIESKVKTAINGRAKALYGNEWTAIKGDNYKIMRVATGPTYEATDEVDDEFLKLKVEVNRRKVDEYVKAHSTLPEGVSYNSARGESIRLTVKEYGDA